MLKAEVPFFFYNDLNYKVQVFLSKSSLFDFGAALPEFNPCGVIAMLLFRRY
jgi:hypothetical protein